MRLFVQAGYLFLTAINKRSENEKELVSTVVTIINFYLAEISA